MVELLLGHDLKLTRSQYMIACLSQHILSFPFKMSFFIKTHHFGDNLFILASLFLTFLLWPN